MDKLKLTMQKAGRGFGNFAVAFFGEKTERVVNGVFYSGCVIAALLALLSFVKGAAV